MSEWQLIEPETAELSKIKKDGKMIILYPNWRIAWWEFGDEEWMYDVVPIEMRNGEAVISYRKEHGPFYCRYANDPTPTHWMPLPEPPT